MNTMIHNDIEVCLNKLRSSALRAFKVKLTSLYSADGGGMFIAPATIREAVRVAEDNARQLIIDGVSTVSGISSAPEAFALIDNAVSAHLTDMEGAVESGFAAPLSTSQLDVAAIRFETTRQEVVRNLQNHRPTFQGTKKKGGRPPVWDWAGVKEHVLAQFPDGLPKGPNARSVISEVMKIWFINKQDDHPGVTMLNEHVDHIINEHQ